MAAGLVILIVLVVCAAVWATSGERDRFRMLVFGVGGMVAGATVGAVVIATLGKIFATAAQLFGA